MGGQSIVSSLQFNCISKDGGAGTSKEMIIYKGTEGNVCAFEECKGRSRKQLCKDWRDGRPLGNAMIWLGSSQATVSIERDGHGAVGDKGHSPGHQFHWELEFDQGLT